MKGREGKEEEKKRGKGGGGGGEERRRKRGGGGGEEEEKTLYNIAMVLRPLKEDMSLLISDNDS